MQSWNGESHTIKGVVYVLGTYPLLTTTFIDREIKTLRAWGVNVHILAVRRPPLDPPLSRDQRDLQRDVQYLLPARWVDLILSHLYFLVRSPGPFARTFAYLITRPHPSLMSRAKTILHFGEGVYAAYLVRGLTFREIHAHFADRAATIALVASRLLGTPYSLSIHAAGDIFVDPVLLREKVTQARHVVTCTAHNKAHVASLVGVDVSDMITHVRHGLDLSAYPTGSDPASGPAVILSVGQLKQRKGLAQLIRACATLRDRGYRFRCRIVGRGPQHAQLHMLIRRLSLADTVTLCGALRHEDVIREYRRATMFVLPCIQTGEGDVDGIPNALAEAMALQVPVVSTHLPAIRELVSDGVNGLLVPPNDDASLADAMARLLDQPDLQARLGEQARGTVLETFQLEPNVRAFASTLWPEWFARVDAVSSA
jgi:colanic acid/amylovoran biosynthesis glycosyltransferase